MLVLPPVPNRTLSLRCPEQCPTCHASVSVSIEQTFDGTSILLKWLCAICQATWPIARDEEVTFPERRANPTDRRRKTRNDRRGR